MAKNKRLEDYTELISACVKCGVCQAHCPTYLLTRKEGAVARGKVALASALLHADSTMENRIQDDVSMCLMCGSCVNKCPNKVPTHEIVGALRRKITDEKGLTVFGKGVSTVLNSKFLMKGLSKSGALLSPMLFKKVPESSGLRLRFPLVGMEQRTIPKIAFRNLFDRLPEYLPGHPDKPTVGFFAGCMLTYAYPEIGESLVAILNRRGYSVFLPKKQGCCGIPALSLGNGTLALSLAERNVAAFKEKDVQFIITACGSCNGGLREYYKTIQAEYSEFIDKVIDFSVFLKQDGLFEELADMKKWPETTRVTYHDPCHLKIQGITREPRELLKSLPNVEFIEMAGASSCCGLGGTFSVHHYQESQAIGAKKLEGLTESGASMVATACPGCMMQLQDVINKAELQIKAVHILELVAAALAPIKQ